MWVVVRLVFFLDAIRKNGNFGKLKILYVREKRKCIEDSQAISRVSKILTNSGVQYAVFKTLRPYAFTTVDVDVLIFGDKVEHLRAVDSMLNAGYKILARGPKSVTLKDPKSNLGIDLYEQIAVSFINYMDKKKLANFVTTVKLPNGFLIKSNMGNLIKL